MFVTNNEKKIGTVSKEKKKYANIRTLYFSSNDCFKKEPIKFICSFDSGLRDRPFNLKGGGYVFLFRSEIFFRTTQELEY